MMRTTTAALVLYLIVLAAVPAGEFNKKVNIGDPAPAWTDLPATDGKTYSLADFKDKDAVVLLFTCNSCPVAVAYEDRVIAFAKKHAGEKSPVALVAVNVNLHEDDRLPKMRERAKDRGFTFPYLFDESQRIAREYGAMFTPEVFVLDKGRTIAYMGAIDDKAPPNAAKATYLDDAVSAVLKGEKPPKVETLAASGCRIKFDRTKR